MTQLFIQFVMALMIVAQGQPSKCFPWICSRCHSLANEPLMVGGFVASSIRSRCDQILALPDCCSNFKLP